MTRLVVAKQANKAGTPVMLLREGESFGVYILCSGYAGHVHGGIAKTWRYVERKLSEDKARALFARKLKGTAK